MTTPSPPADRSTLVACLDWTIRERRTFKVLGSVDHMQAMDPTQQAEFDIEIDKSIEVAGWAPFHYARNVDGIAEPWRFYVLRQAACQHLATHFHDIFSDVKAGTILPRALAACGCLILVTWIPENEAPENPKMLQVNREHLAATSAAVHSLTLALQARGLGSYWSSGGMFGNPDFFERLQISSNEQLIAALFVETPDSCKSTEFDRIPGKQRPNRSASERWSRDVSL